MSEKITLYVILAVQSGRVLFSHVLELQFAAFNSVVDGK